MRDEVVGDLWLVICVGDLWLVVGGLREQTEAGDPSPAL
jgi:hypothetical protein